MIFIYKKILLPLIMLSSLLFMGGCMTFMSPSKEQNSPPSEKLSNFTHFEVEGTTLAADFQSHERNQLAAKKIEIYIAERTAPLFKKWENDSANLNKPRRTLLISPHLREVKYITGGPRAWAGPFAGSSAVVMEVAIKEKETGALIAQPEFYTSGGAWAGTFSIGGSDISMLKRVSQQLADYLSTNYPNAVGGPVRR